MTPTVGVSSGARLTRQPVLMDGAAVTYVVTARDRSVVEWLLTAHVQYGAYVKVGEGPRSYWPTVSRTRSTLRSMSEPETVFRQSCCKAV